MSFRLPSVIVYQEFLTSTVVPVTPFMELCIVGPVYQCEEQVKADDYVLSDEDYFCKYPNQALGANVDLDSVKVDLSDVYIKIWPKTANVLNSGVTVDNSGPVTTVTGTSALEFAEAVIEPDDYIDITYKNADEELTYTVAVQSISDDGNTLTLKRNLPDVETGTTVTAVVKRPTKEDTELESQFLKADDTGFTIVSGAQVSSSVIDIAAPIVSATVAVSYRALRTDIANDFITVTSYSNAIANVGSVNINNPMSVAASIVNSAIGELTYRILPIESDDNNGYSRALDILSSNEKIYVIVPLTTDKDIISSYVTHCTNMSAAEKSKWRIVYANMPMPSTKVMVELNDGTLVKGIDEESVYLKDTANGMFVTNICRVSDFVDFYDSKNAYQYSLQIIEILNDSVATLSTAKWTRTSEGYVETDEVYSVDTKENVTYEVVRVLDMQGIAEAVSAVAQSFKNKRFRYVQPDTIMLNVNSVDELCPGYYLCVALGAMRAGFPPHQGFSTMGISGIKRVLRSNNIFSEDQLAEMAGNGVFWVVQEEPDALPYVLYQTTTDNSQLESAEDTCVAVVDYASKYYKDNLKAVLGRYNVNSISLNYVKNVINSCSDDMVSTSYEYIGPILTSATLLSIEAVGDKIKPTIHIEIPYPVNGVDVVLQV